MWFLATAFVLPFFLLQPARAASSSTPPASITPSTSPFRTVNYITHGLPQQCLTSSRKANTSSTEIESVDSSLSNLLSTIPATGNPSSFSSESSSSVPLATSREGPLVPVTQKELLEKASPTEASNTYYSHTVSTGLEEDSPLEDGKFLSFEDWKRDNLRKSGQSEHIGKAPGFETREPRKRPVGLRDSLDSLGDDAEIDLDFSGFVSGDLEPPSHNQPRAGQSGRDSSIEIEPGRAPKAGVRSKDAGTTCKERFNYASFDCAANVLKWNPEAKSPSAVLGENKDSYMLNECSAQNKFLILELCDDISIDTVVLANFEFFSSTFQTFRVSVSDRYPVKVDKWKELGTFEARNSREVQAFLIENPVIWARYLRIEFLSHYGNEFYCPVSLVRVHGTTMLEDYKHDLVAWQTEDEDKATEDVEDNSVEDRLVPEAVAEQLLAWTSSATAGEAHETAPHVTSDITRSPTDLNDAGQLSGYEDLETDISTCPIKPTVTFVAEENDAFSTCKTSDNLAPMSEPAGARTDSETLVNGSTAPTTNMSVVKSSKSPNITTSLPPTSNAATTISNTSVATSKSDSVDTRTFDSSSAPVATNSTKSTISSTQSAQPVPTMQESFFKSVQKRLQMLESNSSLSLQYIEDQSRALRDAFQKVEQRQLAKTTSFLEYLNITVLNELREFRQQYDQLWQSTVIELEMQRERYQQESVAINARLGVLADEIIFQKRVSFLQLILIVICLGLVLFSKGNLNSYLELPLVQSVLSRSPSTRFLNVASPDTPVQSSPVSRSNSAAAARKRLGILKGHRRFPSEDSTENTTSPIDMYTPPTPVSYGDPSSEGEVQEDPNTLGDPQFDPSLIERPSTSPPVLSAIDSPSSSEFDGDMGDDSIDSVLNSTPTNTSRKEAPILVIEDATPPPKHLKWQLPDG